MRSTDAMDKAEPLPPPDASSDALVSCAARWYWRIPLARVVVQKFPSCQLAHQAQHVTFAVSTLTLHSSTIALTARVKSGSRNNC
jgi:hypothetical protein